MWSYCLYIVEHIETEMSSVNTTLTQSYILLFLTLNCSRSHHNHCHSHCAFLNFALLVLKQYFLLNTIKSKFNCTLTIFCFLVSCMRKALKQKHTLPFVEYHLASVLVYMLYLRICFFDDSCQTCKVGWRFLLLWVTPLLKIL